MLMIEMVWMGKGDNIFNSSLVAYVIMPLQSFSKSYFQKTMNVLKQHQLCIELRINVCPRYANKLLFLIDPL